MKQNGVIGLKDPPEGSQGSPLPILHLKPEFSNSRP